MKTERSNVKFPLWRKKVDTSLFTKLDTPIPNWLSKVWEIERLIGYNSSKKSEETSVRLILDKQEFKGSILYTKHYGKETNYKLFFSKDFAEALKDCFVMSYMRTLESKLRRGNTLYINNIEDEIPFWEFLDIEFDSTNRICYCKAHYTQKLDITSMLTPVTGILTPSGKSRVK